ncbi:antibiotic resistance protein [Rhizobium sp. TRM95111]|uniref:TfuA-like protein n=1 Tax=Rhizobium alarense TaxID=2846851 RepID=UPI001EEA9FC6|nr:TfuA-like protein [Rhizobium alarense]MCF3640593.1 antibiotic resistance protein [Rhizobium alarense]
MKIVFAGPTAPAALRPVHRDVSYRAPARQGDLYRAVAEGATVIGLVDGIYEQVPAVWHKEILFALAEGVQVLGAASMGALRAAECAPFGMVGVGEIYRQYASGEVVDDGDVAQVHGPAELGHLALTEALVNVRATLRKLADLGIVSVEERATLLSAAEALNFRDRTYATILAAAKQIDDDRRGALLRAVRQNLVDLKRKDALDLIRTVACRADRRGTPPDDWTFAATGMWRMAFPTSTITT